MRVCAGGETTSRHFWTVAALNNENKAPRNKGLPKRQWETQGAGIFHVVFMSSPAQTIRTFLCEEVRIIPPNN